MVLKSAHLSRSKLSLDSLLEEIYILRSHLNEMSREVRDLSHPRIVEVSQILDAKLNDYNQMAFQQQ